MLTPSPAIVLLLSAFADPFTAPMWRQALVLLYGTILAPGARTVAAALRAMGLAHERHFTTYHRVLNRAPTTARAQSHPAHPPVCDLPGCRCATGAAHRRHAGAAWGPQDRLEGALPRPGPLDGRQTVTSTGLRWVCLMVLVPVPWRTRPWALPLLSVPALAPATSQKVGERPDGGAKLDFGVRPLTV